MGYRSRDLLSASRINERIHTVVPCCRYLWKQAVKASVFYRIAAVFYCFLLPDMHLVFGSPVPQGDLMHFLIQCRQFTLTCRGSAGHIGTSSEETKRHVLPRLAKASTSFVSQHNYRVDAHCPTGGDSAGRECNTAQ